MRMIAFEDLTELHQQPLAELDFDVRVVVPDRIYRISDSEGLYLFTEDFEDGRGVVTSTGAWACNDHWAVRAWEPQGLDLSVPPPEPESSFPGWESLPQDLRLKQFLEWAKEQMALSVFYTAPHDDGRFLYQAAVLSDWATVIYPTADEQAEVLPTVIEVPIRA